MKKKRLAMFFIPLLLVLYVIFHLGDANTKKISLYSQSLHKNMKVDVYLPSGYSDSKKYPVLYVFHGKDANEDSFMNGFFGINGIHLDREADTLIQSKAIQPLVIISPEIDNSYGVNSSTTPTSQNGYNLGMYEDYIVKELIPYIQSHYSVDTNREGRFAGGFSMGGFVALNIGFSHPELFSRIGGHSAAIWKNESDVPAELSWFVKYDQNLFKLAKTQDLDGIDVYLDHGDMDHEWLSQGDAELESILQSRGVHSELQVGKGGHDYGYWGSQAKRYLLFYMKDNQ